MSLDGNTGMHRARRYLQLLVLTAFFLWQQRNEGLLEAAAVGVGENLLWRAGCKYLAGIHRNQPVKALGLIHIGTGDQHAHLRPAGTDASNKLPELAA